MERKTSLCLFHKLIYLYVLMSCKHAHEDTEFQVPFQLYLILLIWHSLICPFLIQDVTQPEVTLEIPEKLVDLAHQEVRFC